MSVRRRLSEIARDPEWWEAVRNELRGGGRSPSSAALPVNASPSASVGSAPGSPRELAAIAKRPLYSWLNESTVVVGDHGRAVAAVNDLAALAESFHTALSNILDAERFDREHDPTTRLPGDCALYIARHSAEEALARLDGTKCDDECRDEGKCSGYCGGEG